MDKATTVNEIEKLGSERISKMAYDYYRSGANAQMTLNDTIHKMKSYKLKTKAFVDPSKFKDTKCTMLGHQINSPICIASTAFQKMAHIDGEIAMAKGGECINHTPILLSSWSSTLPENVSQIDQVNRDIWKRIKDAGFKAFALTVDTQILGQRENDMRNNFQLPQGIELQVYKKYQQETTNVKSSGQDSGLAEYAKNHKNNQIGWEMIKYIKEVSGLPVIAKGVMCKEDAEIAIKNGADALFVSNHGARQLDTTPATIEVLEEVVAAAKGSKVEIYFDGGVRNGSDVLKALALGAHCVFVGRPILWGLAADGQKGVEKVLRILNEELKEAMLYTGCMQISDIKKDQVMYSPEEITFPKL